MSFASGGPQAKLNAGESKLKVILDKRIQLAVRNYMVEGWRNLL